MANEGIQSFEFDVAADRAADARLNEATGGNRFPSVEEDPDNPQSLSNDAPSDVESAADARKALAVEDADKQAQPDEVARLKKIVGDQGNELGELRRATAANSDFQTRIAQLETEIRQSQAPAQGEYDMWKDVPDDQSFMSPRDRQIVSSQFKALALAAQQEIQKAREDGQYFAATQASGVNPSMEAELIKEHPYLNSLTGVEKAQAMSDMAGLKKGVQGVPAQAANEVARAAARTASFTESSGGNGTSADSNLEPVIERLAREARAGRHNSSELLDKMLKAGIPRYDSNGIRY